MTRAEAQAAAQRLLTTPVVLSWVETSHHNPLWSAGDETRRVEVRWMKTGDYLRKRVERTRTSDPAPITWETRHQADWLVMVLAQPHLQATDLTWAPRGRIHVAP